MIRHLKTERGKHLKSKHKQKNDDIYTIQSNTQQKHLCNGRVRTAKNLLLHKALSILAQNNQY